MLDEPTSALDPSTAAAVRRTLEAVRTETTTAAAVEGIRAEVRRRQAAQSWGNAPFLDGIIWKDYGTDPSAMIGAFQLKRYFTSLGLVPNPRKG